MENTAQSTNLLNFSKFTNQYSLSKTLRFELIPQGKTLETFKIWLKEIEEKKANEKNNLIYQDLKRAKSYSIVKRIIDEYHKNFIEKALNELTKKELKHLELYYELYCNNKSENEKTEFENVKKNLRKEISKALQEFEGFDLLSSENLFKDKKNKESESSLLKKFLESNQNIAKKLEEELSDKNSTEKINLIDLLNEFKDFTTYFKNFHENRKNLYSEEDKFSTIAHRLVDENLPRFCDNLRNYKKIKETQLDKDKIAKQLNIKESLESLDEIFTISFFKSCLTQTGIDYYNDILGGKVNEQDKLTIRGLNSYINNEINQKIENKNERIPILKQLYKLPLFERTSASFNYEPIKNDKELIDRINVFYNNLKNFVDYSNTENSQINVLNELKKLLKNIHNYRVGIYILGGSELNKISQKIFGRWDYITNALIAYYDKHISPPKIDKNGKIKARTTKEHNNLVKWLKVKQWPIELIEEALFEYKETETNEELKNKITKNTLCDFFAACGIDANGNDLFTRIEKQLEEKEKNEQDEPLPHGISLNENDLLLTKFIFEKKLIQDKPKILLIKNFLDAIQGEKDDPTAGLLHFIKLLLPKEEVNNKNEAFYSEIEKYYKVIAEITPLYNLARNYLTQRPYSIEKVKLNFENYMLLDGWDKNKEKDNTCVLLRKNGYYYLGIMNSKHRNIFKNYPTVDESKPHFEKIIYKGISTTAGIGGFVRKCFKTAKDLGWNCSESCLNNEGKIITSDKEIRGNLVELINCYKDFFDIYEKDGFKYKEYNFKFKPSNEYESLKDFFLDVESQGYKIEFAHIPDEYILELVNQEKLYLFKIHNKDFSENKKSNGKDNLHTYYWKWLFDNENLKDVVIKLNGKAEVFYRPKSINYSDDIWQKGHHKEELKNKFMYPIISNRRFALDKFHFHVPITLNFKARNNENINDDTNQFLKENPNINIIGIDRGERHLLYVSVINQQGEIIEQFSLNEIINEYQQKTFKINYLELLNNREKEREKARRDWQTIENISHLKDGYISHVIHKMYQLVLKYNAIIVMEDLNMGFKRGRQKVERQVYQKFEEKLIKKLNYLVLKDKQPKEVGGVLNALQLTSKFDSFKKLGKQSGIVFYVPAAYTSSIDPLTGYVQFLFPNNMADSIEKARKFYDNFKSIRYNPDKKWFEFVFDYNDFEKIRFEGKSTWKVCTTNTERYAWNNSLNNGKGGQELVNVTEQLELLFGDFNIIYGNGTCIKEQITSVQNQDDKKTAKRFYSTLNHLLNTTLKLRHNNGKVGCEEEDYILSPIEPFFDSRKEKLKEKQILPIDADANGAYHIAKKGLYLLHEKLNKMNIEKFEKTKISKDGKSQWLPNEKWLNYIQENVMQETC